jgi:Fur family transcriptional regulator, ferric uptake regulator
MSLGKRPTSKAPGRPQSPGALAARMRAAGLRLTAQRKLIADALESARDHVDAESVFRIARARDAGAHRATVYRTLGALKRLGLIDELDLMHVTGERHFYEVRPEELHIHLVCTSCGRVEEPGGPFWRELKRRVARETGFRPEVVRIEMGGLCARCTGRSRGSGRPRATRRKTTK